MFFRDYLIFQQFISSELGGICEDLPEGCRTTSSEETFEAICSNDVLCAFGGTVEFIGLIELHMALD